jgi:hypothetical protein
MAVGIGAAVGASVGAQQSVERQSVERPVGTTQQTRWRLQLANLCGGVRVAGSSVGVTLDVLVGHPWMLGYAPVVEGTESGNKIKLHSQLVFPV